MLQTRPARLCLDPPQEQGGLGEQLKMSTWRTLQNKDIENSSNKDIENSSNKDLEKSLNEDIEDMFVDSFHLEEQWEEKKYLDNSSIGSMSEINKKFSFIIITTHWSFHCWIKLVNI